MITILILEDNVPAGTYTAGQIRADNPDCPEVEAALATLEAGAYQVEIELGSGGTTTFVLLSEARHCLDSEIVEVRALLFRPKRALASYSGTLAYVRAQSDRDLAQLVDAVEGRR